MPGVVCAWLLSVQSSCQLLSLPDMLSPVTFAYVPAHTSRLLSIHTHRVCPHLMEVSQNIARIGNSVLCLSTWLMLIRGVVEKDSSSYCVSFDSSVDCRVSGQRGERRRGNQSDVRPPLPIHIQANISHCANSVALNFFSWPLTLTHCGYHRYQNQVLSYQCVLQSDI